MKSKFLGLLLSKVFWINIFLAVVFFILLILGINYFLKLYTKHGQTIAVPNLIGLQIDEVEKICIANNLQFVISDSVYHDYYEKGAVVEQHPLPDSRVKEGRMIYLITNCIEDETVVMPDFVGYTVRRAQAIASSYGLNIGNLKYVPDIAINVVIRQMINDKEVYPSSFVPKGSSIDLVVGLGLSDKRTLIPNLIGLTYKEASEKLLNEYLNIGAVTFDETVESKTDSTISKVFKQSPKSDTINLVNLGYNIDIWLTKDTALINMKENQKLQVIED